MEKCLIEDEKISVCKITRTTETSCCVEEARHKKNILYVSTYMKFYNKQS